LARSIPPAIVPGWECYLRMLIARAMTRATVARDTADWASMAILAHLVIGIVSVGLNAVALVNDRYR
jgi:hypothetical protein